MPMCLQARVVLETYQARRASSRSDTIGQSSLDGELFAPSTHDDHSWIRENLPLRRPFKTSASIIQRRLRECLPPNTSLNEGPTLLPDDGGTAGLRVCHSAFSLKSSPSEVHLDAGTPQVWSGLQNRRADAHLDQLPVASREGRRVLEGLPACWMMKTPEAKCRNLGCSCCDPTTKTSTRTSSSSSSPRGALEQRRLACLCPGSRDFDGAWARASVALVLAA
ncbi:hypothetical protein MTO96_051773 [Rhipicephalus appendiculatus]